MPFTVLAEHLSQQLAREEKMAAMGRARAMAQINKSLERGEGAETPAGIALAKRAIEPLAKAIREFVATANAGRAGRRNVAASLLTGVDPELAAYITVRCAISGAARQYTLKSASLALAERLEMELIADAFESQHDALYRSVIRNAKARGLSDARTMKPVDLAARKFELDYERWTSQQRMHVGAKLIELAIEHLGIIEAPLIKRGKQSVHQLQLAPEIGEWFHKYNHAAALSRPLFLPCVVPPKPWEDPYAGAYFSPIAKGRSIISRAFPGQLEALEKADMAVVYKGLNGLQNTPWRINLRVWEVMKAAWEADAGLPCLPKREDEPIPPPPPEVQNDVRGGEIRRAWRKKVRDIHSRNAKNRSTRFEFVRALAVAEDNLDKSAIYFPHRLDFRGRAYAASTSLNPQGSDDVRALLEFAEGKPLGERGLFWPGVQGAKRSGTIRSLQVHQVRCRHRLEAR